MNRGGGLAAWFVTQVGNPQCRQITGTDFLSTTDVEISLQGGGIFRCQLIAQKVANRAQLMPGAGCGMAARCTDTPARSLSIVPAA
jgi:hypothetical protein